MIELKFYSPPIDEDEGADKMSDKSAKVGVDLIVIDVRNYFRKLIRQKRRSKCSHVTGLEFYYEIWCRKKL